ncbi:signal peptidase I [Acetitomaculum ruminis DSM 5522]|uniref:Signal peptidase I n=1 Tax=Acetitomaculum ruminis DSM 5522 TaxID=1120918 RepID=A0A1I0VNX3_9FIRM|nr:signal peptidase I [Acetitomaculum ruminis]SFA78001.1 signal peptidase I [Acetitomaculum ruminis DSM 5522]
MENNENIENSNKKSESLKEFLSLVLYLVVALAITYLLLHYVGQRTLVNGESMENTLQNGDNLIVDKISYRFRDPERFDIIVFPYQPGGETYYIKRIIGLPGETVQIKGGDILIDGEVLEENYGKEEIADYNYGVAANPIELGDDEYFVMGDNRNDSKDSRYPEVGNIKRENIIGRAWMRIWPIGSFGVLKK